MYVNSKTFNTRPSALLGIHDEYAAYCLDSAVGLFGRTLEHELADVKGKGDSLKAKRNNLLLKWLDMEQQFRNPN